MKQLNMGISVQVLVYKWQIHTGFMFWFSALLSIRTHTHATTSGFTASSSTAILPLSNEKTGAHFCQKLPEYTY